MKSLRNALATVVLLVLAIVAVSEGQSTLLRDIKWFSTGKLFLSGGVPSISTGFGNTPSIASSNGASTFRVNVGTGGTAWTGVIRMPTASNGWNCAIVDPTAARTTKQSATVPTTVTVLSYGTSDITAAWTTATVLIFNCAAY